MVQKNNCSRVDCEKVIKQYYANNQLPKVKMKNQSEIYIVMFVIFFGLYASFAVISLLNGMLK